MKDTLVLPPEATISRESEDLIRQLCSDASTRIGRDGIDQFKEHPFFDGFPWDTIRNQKAPIDPKVKSIDDTSNFDDFDESDLAPPAMELPANDKDWVWYNYTYKRFEGMSTVAPANARSGSMKKSIRPSAREAVTAAAAATRRNTISKDTTATELEQPKHPSDQSVVVNPDGGD